MLVTRKETLIATLSPDGHDDDKSRKKLAKSKTLTVAYRPILGTTGLQDDDP